MNLNLNNKEIFEAFESLGFPLETSKATMWPLDNKYAHPPFFRFKFKGLSKNDFRYLKVKEVINGFIGNLRWTMVTRDDVSSYIILPEIFAPYVLTVGASFTKNFFLKVFGEKKYLEIIDDAIQDVPLLAEAIRQLKSSVT